MRISLRTPSNVMSDRQRDLYTSCAFSMFVGQQRFHVPCGLEFRYGTSVVGALRRLHLFVEKTFVLFHVDSCQRIAFNLQKSDFVAGRTVGAGMGLVPAAYGGKMGTRRFADIGVEESPQSGFAALDLTGDSRAQPHIGGTGFR